MRPPRIGCLVALAPCLRHCVTGVPRGNANALAMPARLVAATTPHEGQGGIRRAHSHRRCRACFAVGILPCRGLNCNNGKGMPLLRAGHDHDAQNPRPFWGGRANRPPHGPMAVLSVAPAPTIPATSDTAVTPMCPLKAAFRICSR